MNDKTMTTITNLFRSAKRKTSIKHSEKSSIKEKKTIDIIDNLQSQLKNESENKETFTKAKQKRALLCKNESTDGMSQVNNIIKVDENKKFYREKKSYRAY